MLRESSGGIGPLRNRHRGAQEACAVEGLAGIASLSAGEQVFMEKYLVHYAELIRKEGRSKFSEENS
jgi:hypothetical protein